MTPATYTVIATAIRSSSAIDSPTGRRWLELDARVDRILVIRELLATMLSRTENGVPSGEQAWMGIRDAILFELLRQSKPEEKANLEALGALDEYDAETEQLIAELVRHINSLQARLWHARNSARAGNFRIEFNGPGVAAAAGIDTVADLEQAICLSTQKAAGARNSRLPRRTRPYLRTERSQRHASQTESFRLALIAAATLTQAQDVCRRRMAETRIELEHAVDEALEGALELQEATEVPSTGGASTPVTAEAS